MARQLLEYGGFGTRSCQDMLSITYYAGNYRGTMSKEYTREIQDTYYQLDQDIEKLLDTIDKKVGLANTLVVFTGSGYYKSEESYPDGLMVNGGEFHPKRCLALLNMYLMAIYGQHTSGVITALLRIILTFSFGLSRFTFQPGCNSMIRSPRLKWCVP